MEKEKHVNPDTTLSHLAAVKTHSISESIIREPLPKRPLDMMLSSVMIILALPVSLPIVLVIKLEDGGPVFYRQERWGRDGTRFRAYKFRTMVANSDEEFGLKQATENDPRVTKVGQILRAMGLDELPQLLNIFLGQMSFVGPRSLAVGEMVKDKKGNMVKYEDIYGFWERLRVRPGLTGLATIYIPKDAPPGLKFRYDLLYIRKQSFWLDIRLIALSFWISFRGKWESRQEKL
jgi:lipopolysaccharide/colanic/teichoic acid biosynthesis glycosyltransferase